MYTSGGSFDRTGHSSKFTINFENTHNLDTRSSLIGNIKWTTPVQATFPKEVTSSPGTGELGRFWISTFVDVFNVTLNALVMLSYSGKDLDQLASKVELLTATVKEASQKLQSTSKPSDSFVRKTLFGCDICLFHDNKLILIIAHRNKRNLLISWTLQ